MKAMILAAGVGSRLKPFTDTMPKAMVPVAGKPVILHIIERLIGFGVTGFVVNVHHFADILQEYLIKAVPGNISLSFSDERDKLLDTGGALKRAAGFFSEDAPFLVHNADIWSTIDINALSGFHKRSGSVATLAVKHRESSRMLAFDKDCHLCGWEDKRSGKKIMVGNTGESFVNLAFSGVQMVSPAVFSYFPDHDCFPLVDLYLNAARHGAKVSGYVHDRDVWYDLGTPEKISLLNRNLTRS